jgi:hypothetical protein
MKQLYPGLLLIELPSGKKDLGTASIRVTVPDDLPCPDGTGENRVCRRP